MILFVGLGNPTSEYQNTRHNLGFMVLDEFIKAHETTLINKPKCQGELYKSGSFLFLKPLTYMNNSGISVKAVSDFYKPSRVIVIHDDLDLALGAVRFKKGGSSGGHNGLKSIDGLIGADYERVRLGIGKPKFKNDVINFVLQKFSEKEQKCVEEVIKYSQKALEEFKKSPLDKITQTYTRKKGLCLDE